MSNDLERNLQLIVAISRGIVQDHRLRRKVLGVVIGGAVAMLLVGAYPLAAWLDKHLFLFILYWGACAWLTILAMLMALFDMLVTRQQAMKEQKELLRSLRKKGHR